MIRQIRFLAGILLITMVSTIVISDFFHAEKTARIEENRQIAHHSHGHIVHNYDSTDTSDTINSASPNENCNSDSTQLDASTSYQTSSQINAKCVSSVSILYQGEPAYTSTPSRRVRYVPLFEHAPLFASIVSMRN